MHNLWLSTNNGISIFNPKSEVFRNFDESNELQGPEFNGGAFYKIRNGEMFFGGTNGINSIIPNENRFNNVPPKIELTGFKLFNKDVPIEENGILSKTISYTDEIILDYDENIITFEFASLNYSSQNQHQFAYALIGMEKEFNYVGNQKFATYTNLPSGEFVFKVIGSNGDGVWNNAGRELKISISPSIWRTWFAYVFYLFSLGLLIFGIVKLKTRKQQYELEHEKLVNEKLKKVDKLKSNFLAQMSHEIRTPINTMLNFTSLLNSQIGEDEAADEETETSFKIISKAGDRIIRTIDLILNMSEIQSGTYEYHPRETDIYEDVLEGLCSEYSNFAKEKNLSFEVFVETPHTKLISDSYLIGQIFNNLLNNAVNYTFEGKVEVNLKQNNEKKLVVEIVDTGIGISEENLPLLFKSFSQVEQGYTRRFEGNGLGLALAREYCKIIDARLEVESTVGKGSTFRVIFE